MAGDSRRDLPRTALQMFGSKWATSVLVFAGLALFARALGAAALGTFFLFRAVLGMGKVPADLGLQDAAAKRLSEGEPPGEVLSTAAVLKAVPLALTVVAVFLARGPVESYLGAPVAGRLALAFVLQQASGLALKVLQGELRVGASAAPRLARDAVWVLVGAALVVGFDAGVTGLIDGLLCGYAATLLWAGARCSTPIGRPTGERARSLFAYSRYNAITATGLNLYGWVDVALLGFFLTQASVGAYEVAWRVGGVVVMLSKAIATAMFPTVSSLSAAGDTDAIEELLPEAILPSLALVVPALFGVALLAPQILTVLFGSEYAVAAAALVVIVGGKAAVAVRRVLYRTLKAIDRPDRAARATVAGTAANVGLNLLLIPRAGLLGAAAATTLAFALDTVLHARYLSASLALSFPARRVGWCVLASGAMAAALYPLERAFSIDSMGGLLAVVGFGAAVYGAAVLLNPGLRAALLRTTRGIAGDGTEGG
jgi:O-antigen/teichoic acid export membrane protein